MKAIITCLVTLMSLTGLSQTVSTFLNSPSVNVDDAMAFDSKGNLYGSNFDGSTVYKIDAAGNATAFVTGLNHPNGIAFDQHDNLFVVDWGAKAIRKYDKQGTLLNSYPTNGTASGLIASRNGKSMIFTIASYNVQNNSINELSENGTITTLYKGAPLDAPVGLTWGKGDDLYIGNYLNRKIYRMQKNSNFLEYIATVPDSGTDFPYLAFIAYAKGSLYGTNYGEQKIYRIGTEKANDVEIFSGSTYGNTDGDISVAKFGYPGGIVADKHQNTLYVSQYDGLGNIRKITGIKKMDNLVNSVEPAEEVRKTPHLFDKMMLPVSVNPNPAKNSITLQSKKNMHTVKIFNLDGSMVKEFANLKNTATLDISELRAGLYLVSIVTEEGTITRKFVKN